MSSSLKVITALVILNKVSPGFVNDDTLLYRVEVDEHLPGLYIIGDGSGITHSLSRPSASGVYVVIDIASHIG